MIRSKCKVCQGELQTILDLGKQPPANSLFKLKKPKVFSLVLTFCKKCTLLQLLSFPNKEYLFNKYFWVTGTSIAAQKYAKVFYKKVSKKIKPKSKVLEIASNDGTFLKEFKKNHHYTIGIDPAKNIVKIANMNGIKTLPKFFDYNCAIRVKRIFEPDFIFARNVIPHVSDIHSVIKGISYLCNSKTQVAIEFHYAGEIYKGLQYDSIYHEHIFYFTVQSLVKILKQYNLFAYDVFSSPISGGSLVLMISKTKKKISNNLKRKIQYEDKEMLNDIKTWRLFSKKVKIHKKLFLKKINKIYKSQGRLCAYGASARSSTLLNFLGLNDKIIDFIIDQNKLKEGFKTPGSCIKIYSFKKIANKINNYNFILLLAWNFKKEIKNFLKQKKYLGKIITPF